MNPKLLFVAGAGAACMYLFDPARRLRRRRPLRDKDKVEAVPEAVLIERVHARVARWVSHPRAVDAYAVNGRVILRGTILKREVKGLLKAIRNVPGVQGVDNQLAQHARAGNIPSLQGGTRRSWSPSTRTIVGLLGAVLAAYGAARRRRAGSAFLAAARAGLAMDGATNQRTDGFVTIGVAGSRAGGPPRDRAKQVPNVPDAIM